MQSGIARFECKQFRELLFNQPNPPNLCPPQSPLAELSPGISSVPPGEVSNCSGAPIPSHVELQWLLWPWRYAGLFRAILNPLQPSWTQPNITDTGAGAESTGLDARLGARLDARLVPRLDALDWRWVRYWVI